MMPLRMAWREITHNPWFAFFFILNFAVGLTGFITLDGFKRNLQHSLEEASQNLALGDVVIAARRPLEPAEKDMIQKTLPAGTHSSLYHGLYSMASHGNQSSLIELRAIDAAYPLFGYVETAKAGQLTSDSPKDIFNADPPHIWVYPEILTQLQAKVGDSIKIGDIAFIISDTVKDESAAGFNTTAYAPRAFINAAFLDKAGLIRKGSTIWHVRAFRLPPNQDASLIAKSLRQALPDPTLRIRSHNESRDDSVRVLTYTNDYLGLVSIVALFLSGLGAAYLFRGFLQGKRLEIAILMSLGRSYWPAVGIYVLTLLILALVGALVAMALASALLPLFARLVYQFTPVALSLRPQLSTMILGTIISILGSLLICIPFLWRQSRLRPANLFQEAQGEDSEGPKIPLTSLIPALLVFYAMSVWQAHSWRIGSAFFAGFLASAFILLVIVYAALAALEACQAMRPLPLKLATRYLTRHRSHAVSSFLAISLGILLLNLIPQLRASLTRELERPSDIKSLPSLFLFDIQEDQKDAFAALAQDLVGQSVPLSPMIRARLTQVNGKEFQRDDGNATGREDEESQRMRNRGLNLSYREGLDESETIVAGRAVQGTYTFAPDHPAEVTVEERYAERMGFKLGDIITVEVQDLPITGKVVGLRKVKWNSFRPNFFIQFQPGALDDAPKTFLAAIPTTTRVPKGELQSRLVSQFPNVSFIDVERVIQKIIVLIDQLTAILSFMAVLCLAAGLVVLFSIASQQARSRSWDINMLKILGCSFARIRGALLLEFLLLGLMASLLGSVLSIGVSWILSAYVFESVWHPDWLLPLASMMLTLVMIGVTVYFATARVVRARPALYLAADRA